MAGDVSDQSSSIDVGKMLGSFIDKTLGSQVTEDQTGTQNTSATGKTTNTSNQLGTSAVDSSTANTNFGATTNLGQTSQNTRGGGTQVTNTDQVQRTTGTTRSVNNSSTGFSQMQKTDADVSKLLDVYNQQRQGISQDQLAAIFREGTKQAPQALAAQSAALGARAVGNTPVAQALNMLNGNMLTTAANINAEMLRQAGLTAGQIAELTKSVSTSGNSSTSGYTDTTQDLLSTITGRNTTDMSNFSDTVGTSMNTGSTAQVGNSNTSQLGTTTNQASSQQDTLQQQTTNSTLQAKKQQTINTSALKTLAGAAAAGFGLNQLYKAATGQGFVGSLVDFAKGLVGTTSQLPASTQAEIDELIRDDTLDTSIPGLDVPVDIPAITSPIPDINLPIEEPNVEIPELDGSPKPTDGYADGGMPAAPNLLMVAPLLKASIGDSIGGSALSNMLQDPAAAQANATAAALKQVQDQLKALQQGNKQSQKPGASGGSKGGGGSGGGWGGGSVGTIGADPTQDVDRIGMDPDLQTGQLTEGVDPGLIDFIPDVQMPIDGYEVDPGLYDPIDSPQIDSGDTGDSGGWGGYDFGDWGGAGGDIGYGDTFGGFADGGMPSQHIASHESGGVLMSRQAAQLCSMLLKGEANKFANGGQIKGPGTGISDSIPATSPKGPIKVSNGEYIVPADVVSKLGVGYFDALLDRFHVPAALQDGDSDDAGGRDTDRDGD